VTHISRSLVFAFICVIILAFQATANASDPYAPPGGISATSARLQDVLAAARKARGADAAFSTSVEEGSLSAWGLKGKFRNVVSGDDYRSVYDLGDMSFQNGRLNGQLWRRSENGLVVLLRGVHNASEIDNEALGLYLKHPSSDLRLLGETAGAGAAYVVEVHPQGGLLVWLFFDKKSYLVTRAEIPFADERAVYTYSDFHKTALFTDAWRSHLSTGISQNDVDYVTTSKKYNADVAPADIAMPQSNDKLVQFPAGSNVVTLPAKVLSKTTTAKIISSDSGTQNITRPGDTSGTHDITRSGDMSSTRVEQQMADPHILVTLTINGRGYDFFLDSGAGGIFIDSDHAAKLGLKTFGPSEPTTFGSWVRSYALIPEMQVGQIHMANVIVHVLPSWHAGSSVGTEVIGLVGYDFIANAVLAIDYEKGTVTATNPFLFVPPADAVAVPTTFDDGVPYIPVQIGQASSDHFILDTGATNCFLFSSFADAHPDDVKDQGARVSVNHAFLPSYGYRGIGGDIQVRATEVKTMTVSGIPFSDWIMFTDLNKQRLGDDAGLIGYDFLKYFTVYLDYPQNQVFLLPNSLMKSKARH
jgi:predicted aspartyl protease